MSQVTIIWSMVASACLVLAAIHLLVWSRHRQSRDRVALGIHCLATAAMAFTEMALMRSASTDASASLLRWYQIPVWVNYTAVVLFTSWHLKAGRPWLGSLGILTRTIALFLNFTSGVNVNFAAITSLRTISFLGEAVTIPAGPPNPFMPVAQLSLFLLIAYLIDAAITVWKRGEKSRALLVPATMAAWIAGGTAHAILSFWGLADVPMAACLYFLGMIATMAFELSRDTLRAGSLAEELRTTKEVRRQEVAHLGRVATVSGLSVSLAHEMNQPLGIILSNAQAAQRLLARDNPDLVTVRQIIADIISENRRASEVIRRTRDLLRRGEVRQQPILINAIASEVLNLAGPLLRDQHVAVTCDLDPTPPSILADPIQMQQVLLNLVLNACEAMEHTPQDQRRLHLSTHHAKNSIHLTLKDSGRGLPADPESIFTPFHTTKEQGLGMGLPICRSITEAHHGQIWAEPGSPTGAVFHLVLPTAPSQDTLLPSAKL
jgi:signal transduction histidine kinase